MCRSTPAATTLARELLERRSVKTEEVQAVVRACRQEKLDALADIFAQSLLLATLGVRQAWSRREVLAEINRAEKEVACG